MDTTQVLTIVIAVLAATLVAVGVYVLLVLRDFRDTVGKLNRILGRVDSITESVDTNLVRPAASLAGILAMLREGTKIVGEIKEISSEAGETARTVAHEVKDVIREVKSDLPAAVETARKVGEVATDTSKEVWKDARDVIAEAQNSAQEVAHVAGEEAKELVEVVASPEEKHSRRRYFSKKR